MEQVPIPVSSALIHRLRRAVGRFLPLARAGDVHATHQARVASRRLREAVPVLAAGLPSAKAGATKRAVRKLTRSLGAVRELDVTLGLADELAQNHELPRAAVEDLRAHVITARTRSREDMLRRLERLDIDKLNRRLTALAELVAQADVTAWHARLAERIRQRLRAFLAAVDAAGQMYSPDQLHQVRIAGKKLRYGLELAADTGTPGASRHVRTLKKMQDQLGRLHDLQVLAHYVGEVQADPAPRPTESAHEMQRIEIYIESACRAEHARYVAAVAKARDMCAAIEADILPALAKPVRRRRPLKMTTLPKAAAGAEKRR